MAVYGPHDVSRQPPNRQCPGPTHRKYRAEFGCQHEVAFGLEFSRHERLLAVQLANRELRKRVVGHQERHARFRGRTDGARVDRSLVLEVDRPHGFLLLGVGDPQLEDGGGLSMASSCQTVPRGEWMHVTFLTWAARSASEKSLKVAPRTERNSDAWQKQRVSASADGGGSKEIPGNRLL